MDLSKASIGAIIRPLHEAGLALQWLHPNSKKPIGEDWQERPAATISQLLASAVDGNNLSVRLGEFSRIAGYYLHVLDIDIRVPSVAPTAMAKLREMLPSVDLDTFPIVVSGSGGDSRHVYILTDRPFRSKKLAHSGVKYTDSKGKKHWTWEIELFGTRKHVVMPPSIHPDTGKPYRWLRELDFGLVDVGIGPIVSSAAIDALGAPNGTIDDVLGEAKPPLGLSAAESAKAIADLPIADFCDDRDGWLQVGMALHHEYAGGPIGLKLWTDFSKQSDKFDADDIGRVWKSFRVSPNKPVRMATIMQAAGAARISNMFDEEPLIPSTTGDEFDEIGGAPIPVVETDEFDDAGVAAVAIEADESNNEADTTDIGGDIINARIFASRNKGRFRYMMVHNLWLRWDGVRWSKCRAGEENEAAKRVAARMLAREVAAFTRSPTDGNKAKRARAIALFTNIHKLEAMLKAARSEPGIASQIEDFDADPMLLGVANGVVDLRTGTIMPPTPLSLISKLSGAAYDPAAQCPRWDAFLNCVQPDPEVRSFLQRAVGYTLTGLVDEEKLFFAYGSGANGKSVFANVVAAMLGEYVVTVGAKLLTKSHAHTNEADRLVFQLPGARCALANETAQGDVWDDQRVKELASRERISARKLHSEAFSFMPTHKLWIRGNHLPGAHDASDAFWRRLVPIEFGTSIPESDRVPDLDRKIIAAELPGVLAWAVRGCLDWQRSGIRTPKSIEREVTKYRSDTDLLGLWLSEYCLLSPDFEISVGAAYRNYKVFCDDHGLRAPSQILFSRQMTGRKFLRHRDTSNRRFIGLTLRDPFEDSSPLAGSI